MKNFLFSVLLLITFQMTLEAQHQMGIEIGPSFSNRNIQGDADLLGTPETLTGVRTGLSYQCDLNPVFSIQSGFYYNMTGFKIIRGIDLDLFNIPVPANVRAITRIHFLELPLLLRAEFGNDQVKAFIHAGPQISYAMDGDLLLRTRFLVDFNLGNYDINMSNSNFRQYELAGVVGAGLNAKLNDRFYFKAGVDYMHGLTDLTKEPVINLSTTRYSVNTNIGLSYRF
ncbi:MAG: outer membrane beta-barrel protein [Saprospiraceae bacterium]